MVKLNSADFQRGGFDDEDAIGVARMLEGRIDLLQISGGSYEARSREREDRARQDAQWAARGPDLRRADAQARGRQGARPEHLEAVDRCPRAVDEPRLIAQSK